MGKTRKLFLIAVLIFGVAIVARSQVAINSTGNTPNSSAMLDVSATNKGLLIPNVTLTGITDATTISNPAVSLLVYNTATSSGVTPGFYYNSGTTSLPVWSRFAGGATHYVGELYGGGVVFWVDQTGNHGLICSMIDLSIDQIWSDVPETFPSDPIIIGETAQSDWDGQTNTNAIVEQGFATSAAYLCKNYTNWNYGTGIFSDWYLPSYGELNDLLTSIKAVQKALDSDGIGVTTTIKKDFYWSSTESEQGGAYTFDFDRAYPRGEYKGNSHYVRAVRAF